jgi:hypothetical protein
MPSTSNQYIVETSAIVCLRGTSFDNINSDIINTCINLLPQERGRCMVYVKHFLRVLGCECGCGSHCIAAMHCYDLLVCFETTDSTN